MTIEEMQNKLLSLVDDKIKLNKELEVYKTALYLLAGDYFVEMKGDLPTDEQLEDEVNYYLQEARKEE